MGSPSTLIGYRRHARTIRRQFGHLPVNDTAALRVFNHALTTQAEAHLLTLECLSEHDIRLHTGLQLDSAAVAENVGQGDRRD